MNKTLYFAVAASLVMGCSGGKQVSLQTPVKIEASTQHGLVQAKTTDEYLVLAKRYEENSNFEMALIAYQKALQLDVNNTKAMSGLATAYAKQGMMTVAIPIFEKVVMLEPSAKHYSNLGYAYYLNKQYEDANRVLQQAVSIEPAYEQARHNLALVNTNVQAQNQIKGVDESVTAEINSVNTETVNQILPQDAKVEVVTTKPTISLIDATPDNTTKLIAKQEAVYELLAAPSVTAQESMPSELPVETAPNQIAAITSGGVYYKHAPVMTKLFDFGATGWISLQGTNARKPYIEVLNGNGLKGIAKAVAGKLEGHGIEYLKVADAKSFNIATTHIQYRSGQRDNAVALNKFLLNRPMLYRNDKLPPNVSVRLVLGRDLMSQEMQALLQEVTNAAS